MTDLPYFDLLIDGRSRGSAASKIFNRYVHWGYWKDPKKATKDREEFIAAMDHLNSEVLKAANLQNNQAVLDAGCGFGGTLATIRTSFENMQLTGINIDPRQLKIARNEVPNVHFVEGNACALPFDDASFDRVLAVECIFHFPSRLQFLKEASRVLKPGGRIALSDFVPKKITGSTSWFGNVLLRQIQKGYGNINSNWPDGDYAAMAKSAGLQVTIDRDITKNTLPTYSVLQDLFPPKHAHGRQTNPMALPTKLLKWASNLQLIQYRIVSFTKG